MRLTHWPMAFLGLAIFALAPGVSAQSLVPGIWTGSIAPPNNTPMPATFEVKVAGDTTTITIRTELGSLGFSNIKVGTDRLTFTFSPGTPVQCTLMLRDDKSYAGECLDDDGDPGILVMIPPKASGEGPGPD